MSWFYVDGVLNGSGRRKIPSGDPSTSLLFQELQISFFFCPIHGSGLRDPWGSDPSELVFQGLPKTFPAI